MKHTLSPKQYNMLRTALTQKSFTLEEAATYLQTTFGSMAYRHYLDRRVNGDGEVTLVVTSLAKEVMARYETESIFRTHENPHLSKFLTGFIKRTTRSRTA